MTKKQSIGYKDVDWTDFDSIPEQAIFESWVEARKANGHPPANQSSIKLIKPHINQLLKVGIEANKAFDIAADNGWRGIRYAWVVREVQRDLEAFGEPVKPLSTRQMTLEQELNTDWAKH